VNVDVVACNVLGLADITLDPAAVDLEVAGAWRNEGPGISVFTAAPATVGPKIDEGHDRRNVGGFASTGKSPYVT
jgi:hypothetical protein